ncbi:MAG: transposase [Firmicutes bacterium]|nr:transposase [Bacillota bacterium]
MDIQEKQTRKLNRLSEFDYSSNGAYYITICSKDKAHIFGEVVCNNQIVETTTRKITVGAAICRPSIILSRVGVIVEQAITEIPKRYKDVLVDKYVIMPNHIHLLISINKCGRQIAAPTINLIVGHFKRAVSMNLHQLNISDSIWQKSFYDHIVRNDKDHQSIWDYIDTNPDK